MLPFRIVLVEGGVPPKWDDRNRTLTVSLRKAEVCTIQLSSYLSRDDLKLMGVWRWIKEYVDQYTIDGHNDPDEINEITASCSTATIGQGYICQIYRF